MVSPTNISAPAKTTSTHRASIATSHYFLGVAYIDHTLYKFWNKLVVHSQNQNIPVWNNRHLELTTGLLISCSWLTLSFFLDNIPINVLRHWSLSLWCKEKWAVARQKKENFIILISKQLLIKINGCEYNNRISNNFDSLCYNIESWFKKNISYYAIKQRGSFLHTQ